MICHVTGDRRAPEVEGSFVARGQQFVKRLGWSLSVDDQGVENDQFDDSHSSYIVVSEKGRHLASCRIRSLSCENMIYSVFMESFREAIEEHYHNRSHILEITRLCSSPDLSMKDRALALQHLYNSLQSIQSSTKAFAFWAVVYSPVLSLLKRSRAKLSVLQSSVLEKRNLHLVALEFI